MEKLVDLRQTGGYAQYMKTLGWDVDEFKQIYIYSKKLFFWRFVKIQRPKSGSDCQLVRYLERHYRRSTIYIEPDNSIQYTNYIGCGFRKYSSPFLPSRTIRIELERSEDQLLRDMHYKTRYNIKKIKNNKFQVAGTDDIKTFAEFWQECAVRRGMFLSQKREIISLYNAFSKGSSIHVAFNDDRNWLAALLRISTEDISYYMYAASTAEGKALYAPTILAWEAIRSAKKEGKRIFDFEGIYDERFPLKSWKGFSRFKKGFGGKEVEYPASLRKIVF